MKRKAYYIIGRNDQVSKRTFSNELKSGKLGYIVAKDLVEYYEYKDGKNTIYAIAKINN